MTRRCGGKVARFARGEEGSLGSCGDEAVADTRRRVLRYPHNTSPHLVSCVHVWLSVSHVARGHAEDSIYLLELEYLTTTPLSFIPVRGRDIPLTNVVLLSIYAGACVRRASLTSTSTTATDCVDLGDQPDAQIRGTYRSVLCRYQFKSSTLRAGGFAPTASCARVWALPQRPTGDAHTPGE